MSDNEQIIRSINAASLIDVEQRCNDAKDQNEWILYKIRSKKYCNINYYDNYNFPKLSI
ncbi:hypothetical protein SOL52_07305 [Lactobacillus helveticus]|uniref:Uncharacterized protein n=2 Tax=Lactobacillus helveticus TaxID=1587 RepID=A0A2X0QYW4_LACHE|nr:hypothetical protein [Lactobacillus helveticus]EGF36057.1 hypothetical protein AAULH_09418 [Lactobacillus helveticus MTCC 5463]AYE61101.1 hypothetical protein BC335_0584 [Lactobacillus helveticus]MBW1220498.1 hypothetical protein [Lactobacillus helveticus]MDY0875823.1 hypothetical protein [Lactobacillus helveticus]NRD36044.1 hypothetical protein [Lactobacillus helveticus]